MTVDITLQEKSEGRKVLPTNVKPIHYKLTLRPDLETCLYAGSVFIE
jgi:aminopeptidase 2